MKKQWNAYNDTHTPEHNSNIFSDASQMVEVVETETSSDTKAKEKAKIEIKRDLTIRVLQYMFVCVCASESRNYDNFCFDCTPCTAVAIVLGSVWRWKGASASIYYKWLIRNDSANVRRRVDCWKGECLSCNFGPKRIISVCHNAQHSCARKCVVEEMENIHNEGCFVRHYILRACVVSLETTFTHLTSSWDFAHVFPFWVNAAVMARSIIIPINVTHQTQHSFVRHGTTRIFTKEFFNYFHRNRRVVFKSACNEIGSVYYACGLWNDNIKLSSNKTIIIIECGAVKRSATLKHN